MTTQPPPEILYKYLDVPGATNFLEKPQLRFSDWRRLDDLMEVLPGTQIASDAVLDEMASTDSRERGIPFEACRARLVGMGSDIEWDRGLRKLFDSGACTLFICCLSANWNSGAMWALYASGHAGIVFGVRREHLPARARELGPVDYSRDRPLMPLNRIEPEILTKAVLSKSPDWDYQEEWRAVSSFGDTEMLSPGAVGEIIVG